MQQAALLRCMQGTQQVQHLAASLLCGACSAEAAQSQAAAAAAAAAAVSIAVLSTSALQPQERICFRHRTAVAGPRSCSSVCGSAGILRQAAGVTASLTSSSGQLQRFAHLGEWAGSSFAQQAVAAVVTNMSTQLDSLRSLKVSVMYNK
jgi:hypothetical protein